MRALITGVAGFAGGHLADYILNETDWQVIGCLLPGWDSAHLDPRVTGLPVDLRDRDATRALLDQQRPDVIFHLAAQALVPASWDDPWSTLENNIRAQVNLLDGLAHLQARPRVLIVGSNEEYGLAHPADLPLREDAPLRPNNPYAVSKIAQDYLGLQYFLSHQIPCLRVRPFNHIGPRQSEAFVAPAFARQIARIEAGQQAPVIAVGNLSVQRDFIDVRDVVRAYHLLATHGVPGQVYNVGSGQPRSIQTLLDTLLSMSPVDIRIEIDPQRVRPVDTPIAYCDAAKLHAATGWRPRISFDQTLRDVLEDWRARVKRRAAGGEE